jgi:chaperonin GroES
MKIRPLHDWAVINRVDAGEKTAGGIIIPVVAREKPADGIVEAIGPGKYSARGKGEKEKFVPTVVKPGQRVVFTDFMARDVEVDGRKITLVREEDILGTYEGSKYLPLKESHPVSVREERPLLVPEKTHRKPAVSEKGKSKSAAGAGTSRKKEITRKRTVKKATKPAVRKKTKPGNTTVKKKKKETKKGKTTAKKSLAKTVKKPAKKTAGKKGQKTVQRKTVVKKTGGKKISKKPAVRRKTAASKGQGKR